MISIKFITIVGILAFGKVKTSPLLSALQPDSLFNGPSRISNAPTTPTANEKPSVEQIKYYFYYAYATYCDEELEDLSCGYCKSLKSDVDKVAVRRNENDDTLALITVSKARKEIVIAYRGTVINIWNILLDLDFFTTSMDNIQIHRGFYRATMSLYDDVVTSVGYQLQQNKGFKIVITGHSLGGAIARLTLFFLLKLKQFPGVNYELYTYGEPRVGNKPFADFYNSQKITTARVVNMADIVPHIPPTSIFGTNFLYDNYIHPQTEFWIQNKTSEFFCDQHFYEDPKCSDSLKSSYSTGDHSTYFQLGTLTCEVSSLANLTRIPVERPKSEGFLPSLPSKLKSFWSGIFNFWNNHIPSFG